MSKETAHRIYMRTAADRLFPITYDAEPVCQSCGCTGNTECGHDCIGDDCALDDWLVCKCCGANLPPMTDIEFDAINKQERLEL
jgi:hypothetical protein